MSKAQIETLKENRKEFATTKAKIFRYIFENPNCTIEDIEIYFGAKNRWIGRLSELADAGKIKENGTLKLYRNNKYTTLTIYKAVDNQDERMDLIAKRLGAKFKGWIKTGLQKYGDKLSPEFKFQLECENSKTI